MPFFCLPVDINFGPVITIVVGVSEPHAQALKTAGKAQPSPIAIRALIDTGARCTCVDPLVLTALGLSATGKVSMHTPSTGGVAHSCSQFDVSILIPSAVLSRRFAAVPVIESSLSTTGIQALIGRDLLESCLMVYDGANRTITLAL